MLREKMYVRCPADVESRNDPRNFICGQIVKINTFENTVSVKIHDPFNCLIYFETFPKGIVEYEIPEIERCTLFADSEVVYKNVRCKVLSCQRSATDYSFYYLQATKSKQVYHVCESDVVAAFNNGHVDPCNQLLRYEFQNPCWYVGHEIVSKSVNILENSICGFKELAGCKIYLMPHQVNTIMRCLQATPCRYMLADEVGMGKTIEAISILKIFMQDRCKLRILIVVPQALKKQWETELFLKFDIATGMGENNNYVAIKSMEEITAGECMTALDFVVVDEVHRYLTDKETYAKLHILSKLAKNLLLLSATPVQQRKEEYLDLLRLLEPQKYDAFTVEKFSELIAKQTRIIQKTALILDDLSDYEEEIKDSDGDPHESEDCNELFEEIYEDLEAICDKLNDEQLTPLLHKIQFEDADLGVYHMKVVISYLCSNYQIESNIIRNRRKILENAEDDVRLLPIRELSEISYAMDPDRNMDEFLCYQDITMWVSEEGRLLDTETVLRPLLEAFFSSSWAFVNQLKNLQNQKVAVPEHLIKHAGKWLKVENDILHRLPCILDDPDKYEEEFGTRLVTVMNQLYDELYDKKIVLFTSYKETFDAYRKALQTVFLGKEVSFFGAGMAQGEIELNAYRFQNEKSCRIMLCDKTGGEGRNFQCADYIVHIDLPWDANAIEQRIGRLDRLERDRSRPVVTSVVVHTKDTFENALFDFWNKGLKIFNQSLSGMEIIMKEINDQIISAIQSDFQYGLFERIPQIIRLAETMRETVRKEQNYDAAGFMFRPMYVELKRLIDYYTENENDLFASTMRNWASLAGFNGYLSEEGVVTYRASSFSPQSAINSQLLPPKWDSYMSSKQTRFLSNVQNAYQESKAIKVENGAIRGTFLRKLAIENDYLHFFAPGDAVFDCIVNNAINSCKGCCSAIAFPSEINWKGLVFTWSIKPNKSRLLDHNLSVYALGPYRNYLSSEQLVLPFSIENADEYSDEEIIREFSKMVSAGYKNRDVVHLGKRSRSPGFLKEQIEAGVSNIAWFKEQYGLDSWKDLVYTAQKESKKQAGKIFKRRSNIPGAIEEMERVLSAKVANGKFYGLTEEKLEEFRTQQEYVLEALRHPNVILDSVAFVWMVKNTDE